MTLTAKKQPTALLSAREVEAYTSGQITARGLARDRSLSQQGGTPPQIPYLKLSYRKVAYRRSDIDAFLESCRVE